MHESDSLLQGGLFTVSEVVPVSVRCCSGFSYTSGRRRIEMPMLDCYRRLQSIDDRSDYDIPTLEAHTDLVTQVLRSTQAFG